jgi:biotin synthase
VAGYEECEDGDLDPGWLAGVIRSIKADPHTADVAVTLSVGEWGDDALALWRRAGADRYLLRFETSDPDLYRTLHPAAGRDERDRAGQLMALRRLDYEVGSGVMVGLPGQTYDTLADDIVRFAELDLDMIGVGPYLPNPGSRLGRGEVRAPDAGDEQVPNTDAMALKVLALTRLTCPDVNLPATTALAAASGELAHEAALARGANVIMPNFTPPAYRDLYSIYPGKAEVHAAEGLARIKERIAGLGRTIGVGRGDSPHRLAARRDLATAESEAT